MGDAYLSAGLGLLLSCACASVALAGEGGEAMAAPRSVAEQRPGVWVKRQPIPGSPTSPRKGYESSWDWDPFTKRIIRHGGHNQGGGGAQYFEVWTLDPLTMNWELSLPNTSPPGVCCEKDNVFDRHARRFVRFPAFSNSHGWQWTRMISLRNWSAWAYDNEKNVWRNMRPVPHVGTKPGRCAAYDSHNDVILIFSGEGDRTGTKIYDLYANTWHLPKPSSQPAGRSYGSMVYDRGRRRFVMFGRHYGDDPVTWAYDVRLNRWTDLKTATHPPSNRTSPVMAYDSQNEAVLCVVRTDDKDGTLQTWLYDCRENTWKKLEPGGGDLGQSGHRNRLMVYIPEYNVFVLENRTKEQEIWTFRYAVGERTRGEAPAVPVGLTVRVDEKGRARLSWKAGSGEKPAGYRLLRGAGEVPWKAEYRKVGPGLVKETRFTDRGLRKGAIHYYRVAAVGKNGRASDESIPARTQPRAIEGLMVSVLGEKEVELSWREHPPPDVVGYNVYRAEAEVYTADQLSFLASHEDKARRKGPAPVGALKAIGEFKKLTREPVKELAFLDKTVDLTRKDRRVGGEPLYKLTFYGKPYEETDRFIKGAEPYRFAVYAYRVRALNALGVESGPSPWSLTVPGAVENVFSKEESATVHLKWDPNPEKKLRGYHVYRMNSRWVKKTKVSRLTETPVTETSYSDATSGRTTRRFFVVAVDALGQEGVPSSPVWSYREWRRYYRPFGSGLRTWHQ